MLPLTLFFLAFLILIVIAPQEAIQVFLTHVSGGMLLSVLWTLVNCLLV
jgi:hypothetical protein